MNKTIDRYKNPVDYNINFWKEKTKRIVKISKKYGYKDFDYEFWYRQPAGVLSLIEDLNSKICGPATEK